MILISVTMRLLPFSNKLKGYCKPYDEWVLIFCKKNLEAVYWFIGTGFTDMSNRWPWGDYSHGDLEAWEWYASRQAEPTREAVVECIELLKKYRKWDFYRKLFYRDTVMKGHHLCLCGAKKKIRNCHPQILQGLWKFQQDVRFLSVKI